MKLLLDTRWYSAHPSGVGHHVKHLMQILIQHPEMDVTFLGNTFSKELPKHIHFVDLSGWKKKIYQGLWKTTHYPPVETLVGPIDLAHYTNATTIPQRTGKYILTVHDLAFIKYPETIEAKNLTFLQKWVRPSIEKADHIIAVSDATKQAIIDNFHIDPSKITRIYNGVEESFFEKTTEDEVNAMKGIYHIHKPYLLSLSTLEPRKDFISQIRAYKLLPKTIRENYSLIIGGGTGWKYEEILKEMSESLDAGEIRYLGYIDQVHKRALLQNAALYLHTSLDEGFGIGIVEALASKIPVIATDISCHPEILQQFGFFVPIQDPQSLSTKIEEVISTDNKAMIEKGCEHAKTFSWKKMEESTIEIYKGKNPK